MELKTIEDEVLNLPRTDRALLIRKLISSFDTPSMQELQDDWLVEAKHRAEDLDRGAVQSIPGEDVLNKARALVK
jgi:putative addiction module component (TIGR02574 family)